MNQDWSIQTRSETCSRTGTPFVAGEYFHTLLFEEKSAMRREDLCEQAYKERASDAPQPFSQWRSKFEPAPPKAPEPLAKQTAEDLLRAYMADPNPQLANVRYILALMLERKRQLKEIEVRHSEDGTLLRIYQHGKSGEVFLIPDPGLKLSQVAAVQDEVAHLLSATPPSQQAPQPPQPTQAEPPASAPLDPHAQSTTRDPQPEAESASGATHPEFPQDEADAVETTRSEP